MKNLCAVIFRKMIRLVNVDHLCVTLLVLLMGWLLPFASINLTVFNPVKKALADFSMTDIFYEIQNSSGVKEFNDDIVLVDMTELYDRRKIAQCIRNITRCQPKVFVIAGTPSCQMLRHHRHPQILRVSWGGGAVHKVEAVERSCGELRNSLEMNEMLKRLKYMDILFIL